MHGLSVILQQNFPSLCSLLSATSPSLIWSLLIRRAPQCLYRDSNTLHLPTVTPLKPLVFSGLTLSHTATSCSFPRHYWLTLPCCVKSNLQFKESFILYWLLGLKVIKASSKKCFLFLLGPWIFFAVYALTAPPRLTPVYFPLMAWVWLSGWGPEQASGWQGRVRVNKLRLLHSTCHLYILISTVFSPHPPAHFSD